MAEKIRFNRVSVTFCDTEVKASVDKNLKEYAFPIVNLPDGFKIEFDQEFYQIVFHNLPIDLTDIWVNLDNEEEVVDLEIEKQALKDELDLEFMIELIKDWDLTRDIWPKLMEMFKDAQPALRKDLLCDMFNISYHSSKEDILNELSKML